MICSSVIPATISTHWNSLTPKVAQSDITNAHNAKPEHGMDV